MQLFIDWVLGELSSTGRVWAALAPALLISGYFVVGLLLYTIRYFIKGPYRDAELEKRQTTILTGLWVRLYFAWVMQPVWAVVVRTGVPATAITTLSVLLAIGSGVSLSAGRFALGGWLYIFAGICDFLDGRLARVRGASSAGGAALDSILDRYSDGAVLVGLAWFYRDSWVLVAVLFALVGSALVPYIRAKGEAVGVAVLVGFMQRAERIVYLGVAVALSPIVEVIFVPSDPRPIHRVAVAGIVLMAVSTQVTALQRLFFLLRVLGPKPAVPPEVARPLLLRNVLSAFGATAIDFSVVTILVALSGTAVPAATAIGCGAGAIVNYTINRVWTFGSVEAKLPQMWRYSFVSLTSALLNSGGVAVFLLLPHVDYRVAWFLVRAAVFMAWNFPLHRDYVFVAGDPLSSASPRLQVGNA